MEAAFQLAVKSDGDVLGKASGTHDKAALQIAARNQLLHQEPRHNSLAGAGIVVQVKLEAPDGRWDFVVKGSPAMMQTAISSASCRA
jgi:hypothetical protein